MNSHLSNLGVCIDLSIVEELDREIRNINNSIDINRLKLIYSLIDLTSLNSTDGILRIKSFSQKAIDLNQLDETIPNLAAICVYPNFVSIVKQVIGHSSIKIASVAGSFPDGQSFIEVKEQEIRQAVELGANEIDVVINRGAFLEGDLNQVANEISRLKAACGPAHLKVILEISDIIDLNEIGKAAVLAMNSGADFIKTSTGKSGSGASIIASIVMCQMIDVFYQNTGKKVGFKAAGGISTIEEANQYIAVVEKVLGPEWMSSRYFRIGASSLANKVLERLDTRFKNYY